MYKTQEESSSLRGIQTGQIDVSRTHGRMIERGKPTGFVVVDYYIQA